MPNIRISATEIDSYRDYIADILSYDALLTRLRKQEQPTRRMQAGSAWHEMLETIPAGIEGVEFERNGFNFSVQNDCIIELPPVKELKGIMLYDVDGIQVTLVSKIDGMKGRTGYDYKLTAKPDFDRLFNSFQWRVYILTFHLYSFEYVVCHADDLEKEIITIKDIDRLPVFAYPEIDDDVRKQVEDFTHFIIDYFPERITQ